MPAAKPVYTFEVATNAPTGHWKVADRTFVDRRLTIGEKRHAAAQGGDLPFVAAALSLLKVEGEDLTVEWLEEHLTEEEVFDVGSYIIGGTQNVEKQRALAAEKDRVRQQ